jgi:hypothetical protein
MLVSSYQMVDDDVDHEEHLALVKFGRQGLQILRRPEVRVGLGEVGRPVADAGLAFIPLYNTGNAHPWYGSPYSLLPSKFSTTGEIQMASKPILNCRSASEV